MLFGPGDRPPPQGGGIAKGGGGLQGGGRYIDDVIIGSTREAEGRLLANHDQNVRSVLDHLEKEELWSRSAKPISLCVGRVVENGTPRPALGTMLPLEQWPRPDDVRRLCGFSGLANYCSGYVQTCASIATAFTNMLSCCSCSNSYNNSNSSSSSNCSSCSNIPTTTTTTGTTAVAAANSRSSSQQQQHQQQQQQQKQQGQNTNKNKKPWTPL